MGARADVPEPGDRGLVAGRRRERPPEEVLVERARAAVDVAADEVDVERLDVDGGERRRASASRRRGSRSSRRAAPRSGRHTPRAAPPSSAPSPTSISPAASPLTRPAGSSCSWIQRIDLPSGAREGSSATGCPQTIVASSGSSPRSASLTARETPSRPGVTCTIGQRASRSASAPASAAARRARGGSASRRAHSGTAPRRRPRLRRHLGAGRGAAVELGRRHARDDGARGADDLAAGEAHAGSAPVRDEDLLDVGLEAHLAAGVGDDPGERVDEPDATSERHGHATELERGRDHLRHEAGRRLIRPEPGVEHPGREDAARRLRLRTSP